MAFDWNISLADDAGKVTNILEAGGEFPAPSSHIPDGDGEKNYLVTYPVNQ